MNSPLLSIITVVYNSVSTLEQTILSCINQTYKNIEYIIIDGVTTDNTVDIIIKYEKHLAYWVSEPDRGIYDAMNKGIEKATGEWILFMNAGDEFYNTQVLSNIFKNRDLLQTDVIYGNVMFAYSDAQALLHPLPLSAKNFMPFCHQSVLVRTSMLKTIKFDTDYKLLGDKDFFAKIYRMNVKYLYIDLCFSIVPPLGACSNNRITAAKESVRISLSHKIHGRFFCIMEILTAYFMNCVQNLVGLETMRKIKRNILRSEC
jgi:glycosyltransferase involved in cell wall biosynthesis